MNSTTRNSVRKWDVFEVTVKGPSDGNPFTDHHLSGCFEGAEEKVSADGFYDGDGLYRVRFMPSHEGEYRYTLKADFPLVPAQESGTFTVTAPGAGNHGPVRVSDQYHFAYEDGTPYTSVGTTCYVWELQSEERRAETLASLEEAGFNKIRFCVLPKHFDYNLRDPAMGFPYEGTPTDDSRLTMLNFHEYDQKANGSRFDYTRFRPEYFRNIENCIRKLMDLGIEADLIMMHPYDRWGFCCMTPEQDDLYWNYAAARFSAYRNVWWSLANEYDILQAKTENDWERYASILVKKDPYHHLRSIHNNIRMYDYSRPWVTHCSVQGDPKDTAALREKFGKPVVMDEVRYEGNIPWSWGNITAQELVRRLWDCAVQGGYPGHGETYDTDGVLWWSHGGKLRGESWKRVKFLEKVMSEVPGHGIRLIRDQNRIMIAGAESERDLPDEEKSFFLYYYEDMQPAAGYLDLPEGKTFRVELLDTWNGTIRDLGEYSGKQFIRMPGKQYMALRVTRV
ncbi:MAG: DUF5060 domain-containing protein [Lachnospiraceae bacterium]